MQKIRRKNYQGDIVRIFLNRLPVLGKGFGLFLRLFLVWTWNLPPWFNLAHVSRYYSAKLRFGRPFERIGRGIIFAWIFHDRNPCSYKIIKSGEAPAHGKDAEHTRCAKGRKNDHSCIFLCSLAASGFEKYSGKKSFDNRQCYYLMDIFTISSQKPSLHWLTNRYNFRYFSLARELRQSFIHIHFSGKGKTERKERKNNFMGLNYRHRALFSNPAEFQRYLLGWQSIRVWAAHHFYKPPEW